MSADDKVHRGIALHVVHPAHPLLASEAAVQYFK